MISTPDREMLKQKLAFEALAQTGQLEMQVWGASMLPALWPGDEVLIEQRAAADLTTGDVVLCQVNHRLFLHRVVKVGADHVVTRGDALPQEDEPRPLSSVLGVATEVRHHGRTRAVRRTPGLWARILVLFLRRSDFVCRLLVRQHLPQLKPSESRTAQIALH